MKEEEGDDGMVIPNRTFSCGSKMITLAIFILAWLFKVSLKT